MNKLWSRISGWCLAPVWMMLALTTSVAAQSEGHKPGGEASLVLPDVSQAQMIGLSGTALLWGGLFICVLGLLFGLTIYLQLKRLPVHRSMAEVSDLIYETCKTYLVTQGKFLLILGSFHRRHHFHLFPPAARDAARKSANHPAI